MRADIHRLLPREFGKLFRIYTGMFRDAVVTFRSKVSLTTKALHPGFLHTPLHPYCSGRLILCSLTMSCKGG